MIDRHSKPNMEQRKNSCDLSSREATRSGHPDSGGTPPHSTSPSLRDRRDSGCRAYELKFLLEQDGARIVERRLSPFLHADPNADPKLGGAYQVASLYCDTPRLDVFHRVGNHRNRKFRLRRYGDSRSIFLERKTRRGSRVSKQRAVISMDELERMDAALIDADWPGEWFRRQIGKRELGPVCLISYKRTAFFGECQGCPIRLTFDREVRAAPANGWNVGAVDDGISVLPAAVVCEFKFCGAMPTVFREVVAEFGLMACGVSKYRSCVVALGLARSTGGSDA